jgi:MFS family permease
VRYHKTQTVNMTSISSERRDYVLLLAVAGLWGSSTSQLNLFGVVLREAGQDDHAIALIYSTTTVAILASTLVSGWLTAKISAKYTLLCGALVALVGLISLPATVASVPLAMLSNLFRGVGFGLFLPAGASYARAQADDTNRVYYVGMFTAMLVAPTLFGPALGEWSLRHYGQSGFFTIVAVPLAIGLLVIPFLARDHAQASKAAGYLRLLRDRRNWLPNLAVMQSGLGYGAAVSFLPLLLVEHTIPAAFFFSPYAIVLLVNRFAGLRYLQRRVSLPGLAAIGLAAYAAAFALLAVVQNGVAAIVAGCSVALGYSIIHPTTTEWFSRRYPKTESARPVALINTSYHTGSILAVQTIGWLLPVFGWAFVLGILSTITTCVLLVICAQITNEQRARESDAGQSREFAERRGHVRG